MHNHTKLEEDLGVHASNTQIQSIYDDLFTDQHHIDTLLARPLPPEVFRTAGALRAAVSSSMRILANVVIDNRSAHGG